MVLPSGLQFAARQSHVAREAIPCGLWPLVKLNIACSQPHHFWVIGAGLHHYTSVETFFFSQKSVHSSQTTTWTTFPSWMLVPWPRASISFVLRNITWCLINKFFDFFFFLSFLFCIICGFRFFFLFITCYSPRAVSNWSMRLVVSGVGEPSATACPGEVRYSLVYCRFDVMQYQANKLYTTSLILSTLGICINLVHCIGPTIGYCIINIFQKCYY